MNPLLEADDDNLSPTEREIEKVVRPQGFDDFSGQRSVLDNLQVFVSAAKLRAEALDHVLLHGPPGLGKTTLANIIANELNVSIKTTSGPVLDKPGDLAGLLTNLEANDVLFIDEIHRLSPVVEEYLYSAMEDYKIVIIEEALKKSKSLDAYEYTYKDLFKYEKKNGNYWILDSLQMETTKEKINSENVYHWKQSDFRNIKIKLLKFEELRKTTNNGKYLKNNLIIFLSRPLLIDNNNALLSFDIGNGDMGNYAITHFTALMRKVNNKWVENGYYEDGVFN